MNKNQSSTSTIQMPITVSCGQRGVNGILEISTRTSGQPITRIVITGLGFDAWDIMGSFTRSKDKNLYLTVSRVPEAQTTERCCKDADYSIANTGSINGGTKTLKKRTTKRRTKTTG